jgi:hypothetical protein
MRSPTPPNSPARKNRQSEISNFKSQIADFTSEIRGDCSFVVPFLQSLRISEYRSFDNPRRAIDETLSRVAQQDATICSAQKNSSSQRGSLSLTAASLNDLIGFSTRAFVASTVMR